MKKCPIVATIVALSEANGASTKRAYGEIWQRMAQLASDNFQKLYREIHDEAVVPNKIHALHDALRDMLLIKQDWHSQALDQCTEIDSTAYASFLTVLSRAEANYHQLIYALHDAFENAFKKISEEINHLSLAIAVRTIRTVHQAIQNMRQVRNDWSLEEVRGFSETHQIVMNDFLEFLLKAEAASKSLAKCLADIYGPQLKRQQVHSIELIEDNMIELRQALGARYVLQAHHELCKLPDIQYIDLFIDTFATHRGRAPDVGFRSSAVVPLVLR